MQGVSQRVYPKFKTYIPNCISYDINSSNVAAENPSGDLLAQDNPRILNQKFSTDLEPMSIGGDDMVKEGF